MRFQDDYVPAVGRRWYAKPALWLTLAVLLVVAVAAGLIVRRAYSLPRSSDIILKMQDRMLALQSVQVDADVTYHVDAVRKGASGAFAAANDRYALHLSGPLRAGIDPKASLAFSLNVGEGPSAKAFAGVYVHNGPEDAYRFSALPERLGALSLQEFSGRWLRFDRRKVFSYLELPLVGAGRTAMAPTAKAAVQEHVRGTSFFQIAERLPDELFGASKVLQYRVSLNQGNVLLEDLYAHAESARLGRPLTDKERAASRAFFASMQVTDARLWIDRRSFLLHRATFAIRQEGLTRRGAIAMDLRFSAFDAAATGTADGAALTAPPAASQDVTPLIVSLLAGAQSHLPMANDGSGQVVKPGASGGLDADGVHIEESDDDADGLSNMLENFYRTNPRNPDTDGDGVNDSDEVQRGCNPSGPGTLFGFGIGDAGSGCP